jgi:hypothetical protein
MIHFQKESLMCTIFDSYFQNLLDHYPTKCIFNGLVKWGFKLNLVIYRETRCPTASLIG